ncbi:MAG TPA: hypothetical protein VF573_08150, partial [Paraburkholderia sp.]
MRQLAHRYVAGVAAMSRICDGAMTVALAIGDPNGIGPEIAVKAAAQIARDEGGEHGEHAVHPQPRIVLFGDAFVIRRYTRHCCPELKLRLVQVDEMPAAEPNAIDIVDVASLPAEAFVPGEVAPAAGTATLAYVS